MPRDRARTSPDRAGDALRRLVDLASHRSGSVFKLISNANVTLPQVVLISRVETLGSPSLSDLADGANVSTAALSQMIDRLVQQGLLDRTENPIDRRRKAIGVTARARALLRKLEAARSADYEAGLASLGRELGTRLAATLEQAVAAIETAQADDRNRAVPARKESGR